MTMLAVADSDSTTISVG